MRRHAIRFLKEYICHVRPYYAKKQWSGSAERVLFLNRQGRPLSKQIITIMIREYARAAGVKKKVTAHVFRHTFATRLVGNGADITAVQKMLGHRDLRVTQIYTRVAGTEVKKTHKESHPRERDRVDREEIRPEGPLCMKNYARNTQNI
jgi:integrase/recombinase XerD